MSETTVAIARTTRDDWAALKAIRLESLVDTPEAYGSTYASAAIYSERQWRSMAETRAYYLALLEGAVIGMASGGLNDAHPGTRWLFSMYVTPASRGSGAASALVEAVEDWARDEGAHELYLHVSAPVERAHAFYRKTGFVETGERFAMDRDPSIELITMKKNLVDA
jgi:GNAT superfamily N-acetyltransferase